jgi:NAD(P)H-hydrate epimerase
MAAFALSREQSRRVDQIATQQWGISGLVLMENAGRGMADGIGKLAPAGPVVICCGKGNNGGDGFVIARHLNIRGMPVRVLVWSTPDELGGDAGANFRILQHTDVPIQVCGNSVHASRLDQELRDAAWVVDALLGTGARGEPKAPLDTVIDRINAAMAPVVAVDVPSGLDCDTGQPGPHTIRAAHTFTFVAMKPGFLVPEAEAYTGEVHVCDIGVPTKLAEQVLTQS